MRAIMQELVSRRPDRDPDVPDQREWGKSGEHMRNIVRAFRDLPCNTIMTALAVTDKDTYNRTNYNPDLPGKLKGHIPGFMDIVGYLYTVQENDVLERRMQVAKTQTVVAKDRTNCLGLVLENPTIPIMWAMIH